MPTDEIIQHIQNAAANVSAPYFKVKTTYSDGIVRERVFCYELYHQLRMVMGNDHPLTINGEIDKKGHADFEAQDRLNPDFVFHLQGEHNQNTIVMEVKGVMPGDILKDIETLITFITKYHYQAGVFMIFNHSLTSLIGYLKEKKILDLMIGAGVADNITLIALPEAGQIEIISVKELVPATA